MTFAALYASLAVSLVAAVLAGAALAGPLEDAEAAYNRGDYVTALQIIRPLANQGDARAQDSLGVLYAEGKGVPQDYAEAYKWFDLAASRFPVSETKNRETAVKNRDVVAAKMYPAQIAWAQNLAREWKASEQGLTDAGCYLPGILRLSGEDPAYPRKAIRAGIEKGKVVARLMIDEMGNVAEVIIVSAEPPFHFDQEVIFTLKWWKFPAAGKKCVSELAVNFELK